jgi:hypothetical protein
MLECRVMGTGSRALDDVIGRDYTEFNGQVMSPGLISNS